MGYSLVYSVGIEMSERTRSHKPQADPDLIKEQHNSLDDRCALNAHRGLVSLSPGRI